MTMLDISMHRNEGYGRRARWHVTVGDERAEGEVRAVEENNPELFALIAAAYGAALCFNVPWFRPDGTAERAFERDALGTIIAHYDGEEIGDTFAAKGEWTAPLSAAIVPLCDAVEDWAFQSGPSLAAIDAARAVRNAVAFKAWEMDVAAGRAHRYGEEIAAMVEGSSGATSVQHG